MEQNEATQPTETRREMCEREAREWDKRADLLTILHPHTVRMLGSDALTTDVNEAFPRIAALCRANAEEWRARARRCAR
jgi:hypothetical protein